MAKRTKKVTYPPMDKAAVDEIWFTHGAEDRLCPWGCRRTGRATNYRYFKTCRWRVGTYEGMYCDKCRRRFMVMTSGRFHPEKKDCKRVVISDWDRTIAYEGALTRASVTRILNIR